MQPSYPVDTLREQFDTIDIQRQGESPRRSKKSGTKMDLDVESAVKHLSPPRVLTGHETASAISRLRDFYMHCKAKTVVSVQTLENSGKPVEDKKKYIETLIAAIHDLEPLIARREEAIQARLEMNEAARRTIEARKFQAEYGAEVDALYQLLNSTSPERQKELEERLLDINLLVQGKPSKDCKHLTTVAKCIEEMWRAAATTSIIDCGQEKQAIHPTAHDTNIPTDPVDNAQRFKRLFEVFLKHSGETAEAPDTTGWRCQKWAESQARVGLEVDDESCANEMLEQAQKQNLGSVIVSRIGPRAVVRGVYNRKMERFLRSCAQAIFTGPLIAIDLLQRAPNIEETSTKKLYLSSPRAANELHRTFHEDTSSEINIRLPCEVKVLHVPKRGTVVATFLASYTIYFDSDMNGVKLTCKSSQPVFTCQNFD